MSFDKDKFLSDLKDISNKAGEKISQGAKAGAQFARDNAPKVVDAAKKGADKTAKFARKNAPKVKSLAKSVGEELVYAGSEIKDFAKSKLNEHKNRNNIKVYSTKDVINYEDVSNNSSADVSDIGVDPKSEDE